MIHQQTQYCNCDCNCICILLCDCVIMLCDCVGIMFGLGLGLRLGLWNPNALRMGYNFIQGARESATQTAASVTETIVFAHWHVIATSDAGGGSIGVTYGASGCV